MPSPTSQHKSLHTLSTSTGQSLQTSLHSLRLVTVCPPLVICATLVQSSLSASMRLSGQNTFKMKMLGGAFMLLARSFC